MGGSARRPPKAELRVRQSTARAVAFALTSPPQGDPSQRWLNLRQRRNQKDYTVRLQQFFDHFLKGAPKPSGWRKGSPWDQDNSRRNLARPEEFCKVARHGPDVIRDEYTPLPGCEFRYLGVAQALQPCFMRRPELHRRFQAQASPQDRVLQVRIGLESGPQPCFAGIPFRARSSRSRSSAGSGFCAALPCFQGLSVSAR